MPGFNRRSRGDVGEDLACEYLLARGYEIIDRNVTIVGGEIDIVTKKDGLLRCFEVKFRQSTYNGYPEESVTLEKIRTIIRAIQVYCLSNSIDFDIARIDFLGILLLPDGTYEYTLIEDINPQN